MSAKLWNYTILPCIFVFHCIVYAYEPNFKLENKLNQPIYIVVATNEGTLNKLAWKKQLTEVMSGSIYSERRDTNKETMLLIMGDPRASKGLLYKFTTGKTIYLFTSRDNQENVTVLPQKKPLSYFFLSKEQKLLWDNNVILEDIVFGEFHLVPLYRAN